VATAWLEKKYKSSYIINIDCGKDPITGKRKRITKSIKTDDEEVAKKEMNILLGQVESETYKPPSKITVKQFFENWLTTPPALKLASKTFVSYQQCIKLRIVPWLGDVKIEELKRSNLNEFYQRIIKEGRFDKRKEKKDPDSDEDTPPKKLPIGKETILYHHRVIHRILKDAMKEDLIQRNPADFVDLPEPETAKFDEDEGLIKVFTDKEVTALEEAAKSTPYHDLIFTALRTGMRRGELLALSWDAVDFDNNTIFIKRAIVYTKDKGIEFKPTKSKKRRKIEVTPAVMEVLKKRQSQQNIEKERIEINNKEKDEEKSYPKHNLVFCWEDGSQIHPDTPSTWFPNFCNSINITRLTFHCLRHTHASHLLAEGEDISYVSKRLGHSAITITYDRYFHLIPMEKRKSLQDLDRKFKK
jgi:integrase